MQSLVVIFTCQKCGIQRVRVPVLARTSNQNIKDWMDIVVLPACAKRHLNLSPTCDSGKLDLAIPMLSDGSVPIGSSSPAVPETLSGDFMKSKGSN